ncbi:MAG: amidohydrolase [Negativibacillus sp.]
MTAIINGKVVTVTGETYEKGTVLVENGKIQAVGADLAVPEGVEIIDAAGCWVMPGLIDCHTHISNFNEPNSIPGQYDGNESTSPVTAQVRASDAVYPDDYAIVPVREAGFTTVCILPGSANVIGGTGISVKLRGHTAREMIIPGSEQMKFAFGENPKRVYGGKKVIPSTRMGVGAVLREALYNAKNYSDALLAAESDPSKAPKPDFKLEALVPVVRGEMRCRMHAHRSDDILTAISIAEEYGLDYVIEHCTEGYRIADVLNEKHARVVIGPHLTAPTKVEIHGRIMENSGILSNQKNITVCLTADTGSQTSVLPMTIGMLMRRGLSEENAIKGVTINPAKILNLDHRIGSLEPGKDADIAIFDGHPFDSMTLCRMVMIDGVVYKNTL